MKDAATESKSDNAYTDFAVAISFLLHLVIAGAVLNVGELSPAAQNDKFKRYGYTPILSQSRIQPAEVCVGLLHVRVLGWICWAT